MTYATRFIDGEIIKELKFATNMYGFTEMPDFWERMEDQTVIRVLAEGKTLSVDEAPDRGKYSAERRTLQILEILRLLTDETSLRKCLQAQCCSETLKNKVILIGGENGIIENGESL